MAKLEYARFFGPDSPYLRAVFDETFLNAVSGAPDTRLCEIMNRHGSDKGAPHNYAKAYDRLFTPFRHCFTHIFELGLGTNHPEMASSMGVNGVPGASLRGWREYFPYAKIFGADIDDRILFQEDRISTFYCDQTAPDKIAALWQATEQPAYNVIIDDGLHAFFANKIFAENALYRVAPNGFYIVEDIIWEAGNIVAFEEFLSGVPLPSCLIKLPVDGPKEHDNTIAVIHNPG